MARNSIRQPRHIPAVRPIGTQPDLFDGPTISCVADTPALPKGWERQLRQWAACTTMADLDLKPDCNPRCAHQPVFLVACVAAKLDQPAQARDLYTSAWFTKARAYVERQGGDWFILSAKYGLVRPTDTLDPYDATLITMSAAARRQWGARVLDELAANVEHATPLIVLAGRAYRDPLWPTIGDRAAVPMAGLRIGEQLAWLSRNGGS
jgi:hypothetical protein